MKTLQQKIIIALFALLPTVSLSDQAVFAAGCFWCVEAAFQDLDGVGDAESGYTGGRVKNPEYRQVSAGRTGHYEAVRVTYDAARISYQRLLKVFWRNVDPFDARGQFCDKGSSYLSAIFVESDEQRRLAEASIKELPLSDEQKAAIVTPIVEASTFYPAEDYHQNYYKINPIRYKAYSWNCGRAKRLEAIWGKPG